METNEMIEYAAVAAGISIMMFVCGHAVAWLFS